MKSLVLDSNALIALFDGDEEAREIISSAEKILVPAVVLGEVQLGISFFSSASRLAPSTRH